MVEPGQKIRLAIVVSHPIQHFVPFYRRLAKEPGLDLHVFFMSDFSVKPFFDVEMGTEIGWKMDLVSGYPHTFLPEAATIKQSSPLTLNNPSVTRVLAAFAPDVVMAYGYNQVTQMRVLAWCRRNGVPVMMTSDSELQQARSSLKQTAKRALLPWLYGHYGAFLTTGDNNETYLTSYGVPQAKLFRSPFTIDEDVYLAARANRADLRQQFRQTHGIAETAFVVLTVGKLSDRKRPLDVVEAAALLQATADVPQVHFVLAGDGALKGSVEAAIAARGLPVSCLGFVNLDQLPLAYCGADVVLHPAEADPHPLVMSETACIGLPLIVSDRVGAIGPTDIVQNAEDGGNGIITPCGDVGAIAAAVRRLATEPATVQRLAAASLRIFGDLDQNRSVGGVLAAARHCLAGRRPVAPSGPTT